MFVAVYPAFLGVTGGDFLLAAAAWGPPYPLCVSLQALLPTKDPQLQTLLGTPMPAWAAGIQSKPCAFPVEVLNTNEAAVCAPAGEKSKRKSRHQPWQRREATRQAAVLLNKAARKRPQRGPGQRWKELPLEARDSSRPCPRPLEALWEQGQPSLVTGQKRLNEEAPWVAGRCFQAVRQDTTRGLRQDPWTAPRLGGEGD